jgi:hypothetical protein
MPVKRSELEDDEVRDLPEKEWATLEDLAGKEIRHAPDTVYSNFDSTFDHDVKAWLIGGPDRLGKHAAWDYCGQVWFDGELWHEQVHRWGCTRAEYVSPTLHALIDHVRDEHGYE